MSDIQEVRKIIKASLAPFLNKAKRYGLKKSIEDTFPGLDVEKFVLDKIKKSLRLVKSVNLGKSIGKFNIYYKNNAIHVDCVGFVSLFVSQIVISDSKILKSVDDIFDQICENFIKDENYLVNKIDKVLTKLTKKELISNSDFGEKNLYDLVLFILRNYYSTANVKIPDWLGTAVENLNGLSLAKDFVSFMSGVIINTLNSLSSNVYLNYDIVFDSKILRFFLNRNTNQGKVSDLLKIFKLDFEEIINDFTKNYVGEAFLRGLGGHLVSIINNLTFNTSENRNHHSENRFNLTVSPGYDLYSRRFRWFGTFDSDEFLEISESKSFVNSIMVRASKERVKLSRPTIFDFGTIAEYQIENKNMYSVSLNNFELDKEYFIRVRRNLRNFESKFIIKSSEDCDFIVMSDSQGMTRGDYNSFLNVFERICDKFDPQFIAHLGDFVDDGNNENYWDFLLNSPYWGKVPVFPIAGNHEAKFHPTLDFAGVKNSIVTHFNVEHPEQKIEKGVYYSFEKDDCLFIFLNTNTPNGLGSEQLRWVNSILERSKCKWKVLFTHKSPYSNGPHNDGEDIEILRRQINEISIKYKIDLSIGGHDHVYSRSKPMNFGIPTDEMIGKDGSFINLIGTIFVTLGPIGVKNYKIFLNKKANNEILLDLNTPSFANIKIKDDTMHVKIINFENHQFNVIDEFKIIKNKMISYTSDFLDREIKNLRVIPWISMKSRLKEVSDKYSALSKIGKLNIRYKKKLNDLIKYDLSYRKIRTGNISIVFNKSEFLSSMRDKNIRTIVVRCDIIKFENKLGFGKTLKVNRDLFIKGDAKLKFVSFVVKRGVNFHVGGSIMIDNNRKKFSLYPSICSFILHDGSSLILRDDVWVEQYSSFLKRDMVKNYGDVKVFLVSSNFKKIKNDYINDKDSDFILRME